MLVETGGYCVNISLNGHRRCEPARHTPSGVGIVVQRPIPHIDRQYDFQ